MNIIRVMKGVYMKKVVFITILLALLLVFGFIIFPNKKEENNLTKVRVADTTLTSRTYMS